MPFFVLCRSKNYAKDKGAIWQDWTKKRAVSKTNISFLLEDLIKEQSKGLNLIM